MMYGYASFVLTGFLSVLSSLADAYTLSCPDMQTTKYLAREMSSKDRCIRKKQYREKTYNLGLGRNLLVQSMTRINQNPTSFDTMKWSLAQPIHHIAQFIVEHEATRPYPSPRENLHPPVAMAKTRDTMNLNTPWVEMLIHEQQQRSLGDINQ